MAFGSVMQKLFGQTPVQPQQTQQVQSQNPQATPAVASNQPNASNNPMKQGEPAIQTKDGQIPVDANKTVQSPVAEFSTLWNPTPIDPNAPKPVAGPSAEDIMKAASKVDFTKILDKEQLATLEKGGEGSSQALLALLNQASQAAYGQSSVTAARLVDDAINRAKDSFQTTLPTTLRKQGASEALFAENPGFADPAVAPIVQAVVMQIAEKFPKASQTEMTALAKKMLLGTADALKPTVIVDKTEKVDPNEDWSRYLSGESMNQSGS